VIERLTRREADMCIGVAGGMTNRELSECLHLGIATVKRYRQSMQHKIGARNGADVARWALEAGLIGPGELW